MHYILADLCQQPSVASHSVMPPAYPKVLPHWKRQAGNVDKRLQALNHAWWCRQYVVQLLARIKQNIASIRTNGCVD